MKLTNINGTAQNKCVCGSWLDHWEKFSGQTTQFCQAIGCVNRDVVGAHVQKADSYDTKWYIYPLCNSHNHATGVVEVADAYKLVSANKSETCERNTASFGGGYLGRRY